MHACVCVYLYILINIYYNYAQNVKYSQISLFWNQLKYSSIFWIFSLISILFLDIYRMYMLRVINLK